MVPPFMHRLNLSIIFLVFLTIACGSGTDQIDPVDSSVATQTGPIILSLNPTSGKVGSTVTINGFGFSAAAPVNIVTVGGKATSAATYSLLNPPVNGAIEALTFQVPANAATGASGIFVTVFDLTSNANVQFIVDP